MKLPERTNEPPITDTAPRTCENDQGYWSIIQCMEDTVFSPGTKAVDGVLPEPGIVYPRFTKLYGKFTAIQIESGEIELDPWNMF